MAKQKSFLKFEGRIEDLSFYRGADGTYYVRSKGGVSKDRILNDPNFQRTRENGAEFGRIANEGKMFRRAIQNLLTQLRDRTVTARLTRVLAKVKNEDLISDRGMRSVHKGIQTAEGKAHLKLFEFNKNAPLGQVLRLQYELDTTDGKLTVPDFVPQNHLSIPQGATQVSFQLARVRFDFESAESTTEMSNKEVLEIDNLSSNVSLTWANTATGPGLDYYFLQVNFFQDINGSLYPLHNGAHNALQLIEIE